MKLYVLNTKTDFITYNEYLKKLKLIFFLRSIFLKEVNKLTSNS